MRIDRDHAIRTAVRLLDAEGLDKLSLRRIATELDVKAPALYWHFDSKRALLDHMADLIMAPALPLLDALDPADWPAWLAHAAALLRSTLLEHRDGPRVALGANLGRAVALGGFVERTVAVLHEHGGFDLTDASRAGGSFVWFVVGRSVEEQALPDLGPVELDHLRGLFPTLTAAMAERRERGDTQDAAFRYSVDLLITGLRATAERPCG